jgi:RNA polymerase sigma-70 factor (ECF subfamily)
MMGSPPASPAAVPQPLLLEIVRAAREAWPGVDLAPALFLPYLSERMPAEETAERALPQMCTSDLYLACACARGDERALAVFEDRCLSVVDSALPRLGVSADGVAEVKQHLRQSLLVADQGPPRIEQFAGRGDLRSWVRVIAVREALAMRRQRERDRPLDDQWLAEALLPGADPELEQLKNVYRSEFKKAFDLALLQLDDRGRTLLRQQFIDRLTIDELATLYRVHRATISRWLERARLRVVDRTRAHLRRHFGVQPHELDSILRLIRSQLHVSIGGLVRRGARRGAVRQ